MRAAGRLLYAGGMGHRPTPPDFARPTAPSLAAALLAFGLSATAWAQAPAPPDPHAAQPERPTVATHAYTVAPGWIEIEAGSQRQAEGALADRLAVPIVVKIGLSSRLQLGVAPGWQREAQGGGAQAGITDLVVALKWRLTDDAPVIGAFAIQPAVSLPSGSADAGRGSGTMATSVLLVSSRRIGNVSIDLNAGYTRLGGESASFPRDSTVWAAAAAVPVAGRLGWAAEVFGYPGTSGPAGAPPVVAFLTGPTFALKPSLILDAGATFDIEGWGGTAIYAGLTWNIGRLWKPRQQASHTPGPFASRRAG